MNQDDIHDILQRVSSGGLTADDAMKALRHLPFEQLPYARVDSHRHLRCGFPEVIFCQGKEPADITAIARTILKRSSYLLATRADREAFEAIRKASKLAQYQERARCVTVRKKTPPRLSGKILVVCAGTADVPVAEEARITAEIMGHDVEALHDVGVAGIHRLLAEKERLAAADVIVVVAGMEGALAGVVGGLTSSPVVAVPTSVGYGANLGGIAPLLTMLNSCAAGVTVVNIDNGFGAGYAASLMARLKSPT